MGSIIRKSEFDNSTKLVKVRLIVDSRQHTSYEQITDDDGRNRKDLETPFKQVLILS